MADVTVSSVCASFDPSTHTCCCTGERCPLSADQHPACPKATFPAKVVLAPDEFHVLLDSNGRPSYGTLRVKACRDWQAHRGAGVHVNSILSLGPAQSLLELTHFPN